MSRTLLSMQIISATDGTDRCVVPIAIPAELGAQMKLKICGAAMQSLLHRAKALADEMGISQERMLELLNLKSELISATVARVKSDEIGPLIRKAIEEGPERQGE